MAKIKLRWAIVSVVAAVITSGCAMTASRSKLADKDQEPIPSHLGPVCLMTHPMPVDIGYTEIGTVRASKRFYGGAAELYPLLADEARKIGADAVVNIRSRQQIGLISVVRPVTWGTAVKIDDGEKLNCKEQDGRIR